MPTVTQSGTIQIKGNADGSLVVEGFDLSHGGGVPLVVEVAAPNGSGVVVNAERESGRWLVSVGPLVVEGAAKGFDGSISVDQPIPPETFTARVDVVAGTVLLLKPAGA
jgi:hypothetical protein